MLWLWRRDRPIFCVVGSSCVCGEIRFRQLPLLCWADLDAMLLAAQESRAKFRPCQKFPFYLGHYPLLGPNGRTDGRQIRPDADGMKELFVLPKMGGRSRPRPAPSKTISIKSSEIERDRSLARSLQITTKINNGEKSCYGRWLANANSSLRGRLMRKPATLCNRIAAWKRHATTGLPCSKYVSDQRCIGISSAFHETWAEAELHL